MIVMNSHEISKYRIKLCLFFIATVFYGIMAGVNLIFRMGVYPKPVKEIFIDTLFWIVFFFPYLFLLWEVIKSRSVMKKIFIIDKEYKNRDIIQIIFLALLFLPFLYFGIVIIYGFIGWFPDVFRSMQLYYIFHWKW